MENIRNGVLGFWEDSRDYILCWSAELPELKKQDTVRYQYNQWSSLDCTIYSPMWALSDLMNYQFSAEEIKDMNELSYSRGRRRWEWWYIAQWVKCVVDRWNSKHPNNPVAYYRFDLNDDETLKDVIWKNYTVCTGYQWNSSYNLDFLIDDKLDGVSFGRATYGHAVSVIDDDWARSIKDNYYPRMNSKINKDTNIYEVVPEFSELVEWRTYYNLAYVIVKVENEERLKELKRLNEFKQDVDQAIELNSKMWWETNSDEFKNKLHETNEYLRKKLKDIEVEMNKFSL